MQGDLSVQSSDVIDNCIVRCYKYIQSIGQMGNETTKMKRLKNSYSLDFGHEPQKIKAESTFRLVPIKAEKGKEKQENSVQVSIMNPSNQKEIEQASRQNTKRLQKLNLTNDQLRSQLIKISSELTMRLKKKKFEVKKTPNGQENEGKKQGLKRELQNAYRQIDMYKRNIEQRKSEQLSTDASDIKLTSVSDKASSIEIEINKTMVKIQAVKNVIANQNQFMQKDLNFGTLDSLKGEIEALKLLMKDYAKQERKKQRKYMEQHQYMMALERKIRETNSEYQQPADGKSRDVGSEGNINFTIQEFEAAEKQIEEIKVKHDEYHKRINMELLMQKSIRQQKEELKSKLEQREKLVENLKYKRDALVKMIKDNLELFVEKVEAKEELSEFSSEQEQEIEEVEEEERGTFDVQHLKDQKLKLVPKQIKLLSNEGSSREAARSEPKQWKKQITRIIEKGKSKKLQKAFKSGVKEIPNKEMKIVKMNVWMNKKKQITVIQPIYLIDGEVVDGLKSANNVEDEYKVVYELEEFEYLKSILGIFGKQGFLEYLILQSNFGKISKIGREQTDGDNFAIGVVKEETPIKIEGACSQDGNYWRINRLQFEVMIDTERK